MAPHLWLPLDPMAVAQQFNQRHGPGMTLPESFHWAVWAAEGSDYLEKLDALHSGSGAPFPPAGTHGDLVDISHVRWATANAITAIDLCAATMGRLFCGITGPQELDLRYFDRKSNRRRRDPPRWRRLLAAMKLVRRQPASSPPLDARSLRASLPREFLEWVKDTLGDPLYQELHRARNPLTHSWLTRIPHRGGTPPANRTLFEVAAIGRRPATRKYARTIVEESASLAISRVKAFVEVVNRH
jgi:hypothetical protein